MKSRLSPDRNFTKDTGLIVVLVLLIAAYWIREFFLIPVAVAALIIAMTVPMLFKPLALVWHYASLGIGGVMNRVVLAAVFWSVLLPVSVARRLLGYDPMKRKEWKKGSGSVFSIRDHTFESEDLTAPY